MFAKLLKYEWKSTSRLLGIFTLAAVIAGGVGTVALKFIIRYATAVIEPSVSEQDSAVRAMAISGLSMLLIFVMLALVAYFLGTQIVLLYRFYKNKFTDEGYLTFTLPVKSHQILCASWLNMLLWTLITGLVIGVIVVVMVFSAADGEVFFDRPVLDDFVFYYDELYDGYGALYGVFTVLSKVLEWLIAPLITMTCITIGAVAAKKHKILLAIVIYYGYTMVSGIISTVVSSVVAIATYAADTQVVIQIPPVCGVLVQILVGVLCWFLTNHLMNRKLNLP